MIHIITSNIIPITSIRNYDDNFQLVHSKRFLIAPFHPVQYGYSFSVYHQDGMELSEEDYESSTDMKFDLLPVNSVPSALDAISIELAARYEEEQQKEPEDREEMTIAVCCDYRWSRQVYRYLSDRFAETCPDLSCLDLYTYLKIGSTERMKELLMSNLNTKFIYPEDPVAFGYALHKALGGRL